VSNIPGVQTAKAVSGQIDVRAEKPARVETVAAATSTAIRISASCRNRRRRLARTTRKIIRR